jgi:hypothetical protein
VIARVGLVNYLLLKSPLQTSGQISDVARFLSKVSARNLNANTKRFSEMEYLDSRAAL